MKHVFTTNPFCAKASAWAFSSSEESGIPVRKDSGALPLPLRKLDRLFSVFNRLSFDKAAGEKLLTFEGEAAGVRLSGLRISGVLKATGESKELLRWPTRVLGG